MIPIILFMVFTNAAAQLMLKQGMLTIGAIDFSSGSLTAKLIAVALSPWVIAGMISFGISMVGFLYVLSKVELTFAYPFLVLTQVIVAVTAWYLWDENLSPMRIAGIALICIGTVLIAQTGEPAPGSEPAPDDPEARQSAPSPRNTAPS